MTTSTCVSAKQTINKVPVKKDNKIRFNTKNEELSQLATLNDMDHHPSTQHHSTMKEAQTEFLYIAMGTTLTSKHSHAAYANAHRT